MPVPTKYIEKAIQTVQKHSTHTESPYESNDTPILTSDIAVSSFHPHQGEYF